MKLHPRSRRRPVASSVALSWSHLGRNYRVTAWPDAVAETEESEGTWRATELTEAVLASGALSLGTPAWRRYLEFVPAIERAFVEQFAFGRLAALRVLTACPHVLGDLVQTPALTAFLAAHEQLRGMASTGWREVAAVHERSGVFGLLEWLGLPASRDTLAVLQNLIDPDVPRRLLEPLRRHLWEPAAVRALQRCPIESDRQLARLCHALAA